MYSYAFSKKDSHRTFSFHRVLVGILVFTCKLYWFCSFWEQKVACWHKFLPFIFLLIWFFFFVSTIRFSKRIFMLSLFFCTIFLEDTSSKILNEFSIWSPFLFLYEYLTIFKLYSSVIFLYIFFLLYISFSI